MSETTGISWTDHTFNPWWGCHKVSDECTNCYAEATADRFHPGHWGLKAPRWFFSDKHWDEPRRWNARAWKLGERRRVFCASMADVFEAHPLDEVRQLQDEARSRLWRLINDTPCLDWLLLTKRPENFAALLPWTQDGKPWRNVWLGVTAGARKSLSRVAQLRSTTAAVRFISCEPLLEHITASDWDMSLCSQRENPEAGGDIDWLIVGDESGRDRRPAKVEWVRATRDAAERHRVAFHFKQWCGPSSLDVHGARSKLNNGRQGKIHLPVLDGKQHAAFPRTA